MRDLRAAASCLTCVPLFAAPSAVEPFTPRVVTFGRLGEPVTLRDAATEEPGGLLFDARLEYRLAPNPVGVSRQWRIVSTAYEYRLLDRKQIELLAFHWQPDVASRGPDHPHLHVSAGLSAWVSATERRRIDLDKLHIPTGLLSLADIVRMLIDEFAVAPLHDDWRARLDRVAPRLGRRFAGEG